MAGAAVAGFLTSALVGIAKAKLGSAVAEQAGLLWSFGDHLEDMKDVLETISAALEDAERRSVKEKLVRLCLKRLKDVAVDISDELEGYRDSSDQAKAKMPGVLAFVPEACQRIAVGNRMKRLKEKLRKIKTEFDIFNFEKGSSTTNEKPYDERETTSKLPKEPVIGRDGEKQEIIKLLSANTSNNNGIVVVPIYGLGGMGKSTLAQLVYNDSQFKQYAYRIWVYVSRDFNLNKIGSTIISQLPTQGGQQNLERRQVIDQHLENLFHGKQVLVVLDDLWEEKQSELDKLRNMLHVRDSKVDVIVTTRKEDIARKVSTCQPYKLRPMEDSICWEIIKRSSGFEQKSNQEKLEQIGLDIAKKCGGVALAAQAIGLMLGSIDDLPGWRKVNSSDIWNVSSDEDNYILPSLMLSYERMPPELRICFSYCAIFPKGHNIVEDDLVQQWIALDFVEPLKGKEYIKQLLGMSFLQVSKLYTTSQKHVVHYTMHDLVHNLASSTMPNELMIFDVVPQRHAHAHKYCRYSSLRKYDQAMNLAKMPPKMRALRFSESGELDIRSGAFSFAKCLRTLDFSDCSGILLPPSIGKLKQLRCLIAPRMRNRSLPECITELSKLQYLNLNGSSQISALPGSIGNLGCLKHLGLSGCSGISTLPESFGDLKCMVHLDMSGCAGIRELPESLGNLTNLQHLELSRCSNLKKIPESLCGLTQLQYLNLSFCNWLYWIPEAIGSLVDLKYLNMSLCDKIGELPDSLMKLQNLLHLNLSGCYNMREGSLGALRCLTTLEHLNISWIWGISIDALLDFVGDLTNLKYLSLKNCGLTSLLAKEGNDRCVTDIIGTLTNLEHLDLSWNSELECLPESIGNLKRLQTLDLSRCYRLKSLPESIGELGLKSLVLDDCSDELMGQASSLVNYLQTLPVFKVRADDVNGCSNLHLLETVHAVDLRIRSLENVRFLEEAKKVKLLEKHNLSNLTMCWTEDAVRLLDDKDLLGQLMPPRDLKKMHLEGYRSTSFPGWLMGISHYLTNLVDIKLVNLPTCSNLPPLGQLPHLVHLALQKLPSIKIIDREFCGGKGAFPELSTFLIADMLGLEEWNTTYSYSVEDGVEEFMFPVLDILGIHDCPRLRLKPCPPTFRDFGIYRSDQVILSLEEIDKTSQGLSPSRAISLDLEIRDDSCQSIRLFHHFPVLRELSVINGCNLTSLPECIRHLASLESLMLLRCEGISAVPEWLGDLFSLKSLVIERCNGIKYLPACMQQLTELRKLEIRNNKGLKEWCESEENKTKLAHINVRLIDED